MEQPGAPCPPGFFGAGPGLPAEQGGRGREQEKSVAKTGGNEQQRTLATSANFSGFLGGPAQGTRSREAKQWRIVLRTGQVTPGVCTCFLSSRRPLQRWVGGAASIVGSQGQRSVQTGLSGAGGQAPARCARCSSPGSVRRRRRCGPAVTAPGRGPARPAGPQRGWLWHTTGADLQGRTRGLAPSSTTPETQPHETQSHTLKQERARMCKRQARRGP